MIHAIHSCCYRLQFSAWPRLSRADDQTISNRETATAKSDSAAPKVARPAGEEYHTTNDPSIMFDGETFLFAWEGASSTSKIKEFVPAGQTPRQLDPVRRDQ